MCKKGGEYYSRNELETLVVSEKGLNARAQKSESKDWPP